MGTQNNSARNQAAPFIKMYINPTVTISEAKQVSNRQSLSPSKRSKKHQEDIIRSLAEERDSYFSKLKDIEDELRVIEEQTKNVSVTKRVNVNKNANVTNSLNFCTCKINSI